MDHLEAEEMAWHLIDASRAVLTRAELNAVSIHLGIGEHEEAIHLMLRAVVRNARGILTPDLLGRPQWALWFYVDDDREAVGTLLSQAARTG